MAGHRSQQRKPDLSFEDQTAPYTCVLECVTKNYYLYPSQAVLATAPSVQGAQTILQDGNCRATEVVHNQTESVIKIACSTKPDPDQYQKWIAYVCNSFALQHNAKSWLSANFEKEDELHLTFPAEPSVTLSP